MMFLYTERSEKACPERWVLSKSPNVDKSFSSKGNSRCKGPEVGTRLVR